MSKKKLHKHLKRIAYALEEQNQILREMAGTPLWSFFKEHTKNVERQDTFTRENKSGWG